MHQQIDSSGSSSSSDKQKQVKKPTTPQSKPTASTPKQTLPKVQESSSTSSSSSDKKQATQPPTKSITTLKATPKGQVKGNNATPVAKNKATPQVKAAVNNANKKESSSSSSSDSDVKNVKITPVAQNKATPQGKAAQNTPKVNTTTFTKKEESSDSSSSDDVPATKGVQAKTDVKKTEVKTNPPSQTKVPVPSNVVKKKSSSSSSSSSDKKSVPVVQKANTEVKKTEVKKTEVKATPVGKKKESSSSSSSSAMKVDTPNGNKTIKPPAPEIVEKKKKGSDDSESSEMIVDLKPQATKTNTNNNNNSFPQKRKFEGNNDSNKKPKFENSGGDEGARVRLGNLSFELDGKEEEIKKHFQSCGDISNVEMIVRNDGRFAGVAIIQFADKNAASKAISDFNETEFYGRNLKLSFSNEKKGANANRKQISEKPEGCTTIFIANLSFDVSEQEVIDFFSDCGDVRECRWPKGEFTGIGWVEFSNTDEVDLAIKKNGTDLHGRPIRIDYATARRKNF